MPEINDSFKNIKNSTIVIGSNYEVPKVLTPNIGQYKNIFIGRQEELKEIDKRLQESNSLLLLNGIGGIGKSALAGVYLAKQKDSFDYYGYVEVGENIKEAFYSAFEDSLQLSEEDKFQNIILKLRNLEGNKLLIIDDVKNVNEQIEELNLINTLIQNGYKIIFTSRVQIEDVKNYSIGTLNKEDAIKLFLEHSQIEYSKKIDKILEYIDYHTLFIELIAKTIKNEGYSLQSILDKFENDELCKIEYEDTKGAEKTINHNLNELFNLQNLSQDYKLLLKKLSILPSIPIESNLLKEILKLERLGKLNHLVNIGWLIKEEKGFKLHQIIKEYLLYNHTPSFEEVEEQIDYFMDLIQNSADAQVAINNRDKLIYFEAITDFINKIKVENSKAIKLLGGLGSIYYSLGNYYKALPLYKKTLEIRQKVLGENNLGTAISYNNLAQFYNSLGQYNKALPLQKRALEIRKKILGDNHSDTAITYDNLAEIYKHLGEYKKALPLYKKALNIIQNTLGEKHKDTAITCGNLAETYKYLGEYQKALSLYERSLKINKNILGEYHPNTIISYGNLAGLYYSIKQYKKALPFFKKALEKHKKIFGDIHPDTATSYNNLALCYSSLNKYKKALSYHKKSLSISKEIFGDTHPKTASSYNNLAIFFFKANELKKAKKYMQNAVEIWEKVLPEKHPNLIDSKRSLKMIEVELQK